MATKEFSTPVGNRNTKWDMPVVDSSALPRSGWFHVILSCGHECDLQLGDFPVPKKMRCIPCKRQDEKAVSA